MYKYHPLNELAPRDVVSRAILSEMKLTGSEYVHLDMRDIPRVTERFPNIYRTCLQRGIDLTRDRVPVSPAAHYTMGGIHTDINGQTGIAGLYACGETACTGVHGANRLASNSLLEGIVFGQRIADQANEIMYRRQLSRSEALATYNPEWVWVPRPDGIDPQQARQQLQQIMWEDVGIIRHQKGLQKAYEKIQAIYNKLGPGEDLLAYLETINMLTVAHVVVQAARWRQESRGGHFRSDYPTRDDMRWDQHRTLINC